MKPHELAAIRDHPVRGIFLAAARSATPPRKSEIIKECEQAGLNEQQTDRVLGLARGLIEEREKGYGSFTMARVADEITLQVVKKWGQEDSLDGSHGLWHPHFDQEVDHDLSEETAGALTDPKSTRVHQETVTYEDGSTARL